MKKNVVLDIRDLTLHFKSKRLFEDLSFSIGRGEKAVITGKSGSGKTSLLKCILGFSTPLSGSISIKDKILTVDSVWKTRQLIGLVPQEPDLGHGTVLEFLKQPFGFKANKSLRWDDTLLFELMSAFHLEKELLQKDTSLLSGGEKQRFALVSALLLKREFYLLDEVTSALDDETRMSVVDYLRGQKNLTFLFVSHDKDIKALSHKTITLKKGPGSA